MSPTTPLELRVRTAIRLFRRVRDKFDPGDVVTELLIPLQDRDEAKVQDLLAQYRSAL